MKVVAQLNEDGYFIGMTAADKSPLEADVYLIPSGAVDADEPIIPDGHRAKWNNGWEFEAIPQPEPEPDVDPKANWTYAEYRQSEYPKITEYLDGIVKGDQAQIDKYIAGCLAVKAKYPKPAE